MSADECPNCGAEEGMQLQHGATNFICGTVISGDPTRTRVSDLCRERAARLKAEEELAKTKCELGQERDHLREALADARQLRAELAAAKAALKTALESEQNSDGSYECGCMPSRSSVDAGYGASCWMCEAQEVLGIAIVKGKGGAS